MAAFGRIPDVRFEQKPIIDSPLSAKSGPTLTKKNAATTAHEVGAVRGRLLEEIFGVLDIICTKESYPWRAFPCNSNPPSLRGD